MDAVIQLKKLSKVFNSPAGEQVALQELTLQIQQGEFVAIVGQSGSGKSTLLNMITGIDHQSSGEVIVNNAKLIDLSEDQLAKWRGHQVGIVFQFFQLLPALNLQQNIMLPMDLLGLNTRKQRVERAMDLLRAVGLETHASKYPNQLSGGEQQRVAFARALANDPPILVADEPTGNLDSHNADIIQALLAKCSTDGKTVVLVTHAIELARSCQRVIHLADGRQVQNHLNGKSLDGGSQ